MNKLIRAGIKRMFRLKTIYICLAVLFFIGGFDIIKEFLFREPGKSLPGPEGYLVSGFLAMVLLSAVLITSFLGSEHQYGTLRNKISVGYDRFSIYFNNFLVCYAAVLIMYVFVWLQTTLLGNLMLGGYKSSNKGLISLMILSFLAFTALTALFVMMGLCIHSKSAGSVAAVIVAFVIMLCAVGTVQLLSIPEYLPVEEIAEMELPGYERVPGDPAMVINPDYVGGSRRNTIEIVHDLNPMSQLLMVPEDADAKNIIIPAAELVILLAAGMIIFKKRDLK